MDYNHHIFFSPEEISIPIPNPGQHPSAPIRMLRRENYHPLHDSMSNSMMALSNYAHTTSISPVEDAEELDTSSRPRLTQEQIATLEDHFKERPKPGTEFKKHLAAQIGLSLQRVNNWYQNRRAKARHQKPQERSFDVLPVQPDSPWGSPNPPFPNVPPGQDQYQERPQHMPASDIISHTNNGLVELAKACNPHLTRAQIECTEARAGMTIVSNEGCTVETDPIFAATEKEFSTLTGDFPLMPDWDISNWIAETSMEPPFQNEKGMDFGLPLGPFTTPMVYPHSADGFDAANSSCQTLFSTSSSDGDACLMTPPLKTSPMTSMPPELEIRRGSNSSELANNLDTIRLQQPRSRTGLRDEVFCSPPPSDVGAILEGSFLSEPRLSVNGAPAAFGKVGGRAFPVDLASRRKRPRPAALRPDAQRSYSCAGPLTLSPHSQVSSSIGIGANPSVRRIRSTGQNLNVTSGGVQKPGLRSAQMSPRNLQSFLDATGLRPPSAVTSDGVDRPEASALHGNPPTPLTPCKAELQPDVWSNFDVYAASPAFRWDSNGPDAPYAPVTRHEISSPPVTPFHLDAFPQMFPAERPHHSSYHCPPQSAPPQQTTFLLGDSPPIAPTANHPAWHMPVSAMPGGTYYDDSTITLARPAHVLPFNFSKPNYHSMAPPQQYSHGIPTMAPGRSAFLGTPPAPQKEIEIQVNLIPKPQGAPQPRKQYTFNHTTPKDYSSSVCAS